MKVDTRAENILLSKPQGGSVTTVAMYLHTAFEVVGDVLLFPGRRSGSAESRKTNTRATSCSKARNSPRRVMDGQELW